MVANAPLPAWRDLDDEALIVLLRDERDPVAYGRALEEFLRRHDAWIARVCLGCAKLRDLPSEQEGTDELRSALHAKLGAGFFRPLRDPAAWRGFVRAEIRQRSLDLRDAALAGKRHAFEVSLDDVAKPAPEPPGTGLGETLRVEVEVDLSRVVKEMYGSAKRERTTAFVRVVLQEVEREALAKEMGWSMRTAQRRVREGVEEFAKAAERLGCGHWAEAARGFLLERQRAPGDDRALPAV